MNAQREAIRHGVLSFAPRGDAEFATASLRVANYDVFESGTCGEAEDLLETHGPCGNGHIVALLIEASKDPLQAKVMINIARARVGSAPLPIILILGADQAAPVPDADDIACLRHPTSTPAMARLVARCVAERTVTQTVTASGPGRPVPRLEQDDAALSPVLVERRTRSWTPVVVGLSLLLLGGAAYGLRTEWMPMDDAGTVPSARVSPRGAPAAHAPTGSPAVGARVEALTDVPPEEPARDVVPTDASADISPASETPAGTDETTGATAAEPLPPDDSVEPVAEDGVQPQAPKRRSRRKSSRRESTPAAVQTPVATPPPSPPPDPPSTHPSVKAPKNSIEANPYKGAQ